MRSRTIREGAVGLFIIVGLAVFAGLILWVRNITLPGNRSYKAIVEFENAGGMKVDAVVQYRGVNVGKIINIVPSSNGVDVTIEISPADLVIPRDAVIESSQSGLIGETFIEIIPRKQLPEGITAKPLDSKCDRDLIICHQSRVPGEIGVNFRETLRTTTRMAKVYSDPTFVNDLNLATQKATMAAAGVAQLTRELSGLTRTAQQQLITLSANTNSLTKSADRTAFQFGIAANQLAFTAQKYGGTAEQLNTLLASNQGTLASTLNNLNQASEDMQVLVSSLKPAVQQFGKGELLKNLESVSADLRNFSTALTTLNNPENIVGLQKTLDSARMTFENVQKITADLDDLTGDPTFRNNLRNLVNGLSGLVSSTEQLEQQVQLARTLEPLSRATITPNPTVTVLPQPYAATQLIKQVPVRVIPRTLFAPQTQQSAQMPLKPLSQPPVDNSIKPVVRTENQTP